VAAGEGGGHGLGRGGGGERLRRARVDATGVSHPSSAGATGRLPILECVCVGSFASHPFYLELRSAPLCQHDWRLCLPSLLVIGPLTVCCVAIVLKDGSPL
jgi:hypothetical protein